MFQGWDGRSKGHGGRKKTILILMLTFCLEDGASEGNGGKKEARRLGTDNIRESILCGVWFSVGRKKVRLSWGTRKAAVQKDVSRRTLSFRQGWKAQR